MGGGWSVGSSGSCYITSIPPNRRGEIISDITYVIFNKVLAIELFLKKKKKKALELRVAEIDLRITLKMTISN